MKNAEKMEKAGFNHHRALVLAYLEGSWPLKNAPEEVKVQSFWCVTDEQQANFIAQYFFDHPSQDFKTAMMHIREIEEAFQKSKRAENIPRDRGFNQEIAQSESVTAKRIALLKQALKKHKPGNWKDALVGAVNTKGSLRRFFGRVRMSHIADQWAAQNMRFPEGSRPIIDAVDTTEFGQHRAAILGNLSLSNIAHELKQLKIIEGTPDLVETLVPDACDSVYITNKEGETTSLVFALAHSLQKPFCSQQEALQAALSAKYMSKHMRRLFSMNIVDGDKFKKHLLRSVEDGASEVMTKTNNDPKPLTLLAVRTYINQNKLLRVIGVNVGDHILMGWSPNSRSVIKISCAQVDDQGYSAVIPANYKDHIRVFDETVPLDTILLPISAGLTQFFNLVTENISVERKSFTNSLFEDKSIHNILSRVDDPTPQNCIIALTEHALRQFLHELPQQMRSVYDTQSQIEQLTKDQEIFMQKYPIMMSELDQRKAALESKIATNGGKRDNALSQEEKTITTERSQLEQEQRQRSEQLRKLGRQQYHSKGDNFVAFAMRMPSFKFDSKERQENLQMHAVMDERSQLSCIKRTYDAIEHALEPHFPKEKYCDPNNMQSNRDLQLHRVRNASGFSTIHQYAAYLFCEMQAISDRKDKIGHALHQGWMELQNFHPQLRMVLTDQIVNRTVEPFVIISDPKLNQECAIELFKFINGEETSTKYSAVNLKFAFTSVLGAPRTHSDTGQIARIQAGGSLAMQILSCEKEQDYQQWVLAAKRVITTLREAKVETALVSILETQIAKIAMLFPQHFVVGEQIAPEVASEAYPLNSDPRALVHEAGRRGQAILENVVEDATTRVRAVVVEQVSSLVEKKTL